MLIRPLTIDDTPTLLPWRNDELTRAMSRTNTFIIDLESYRAVVGGWLALPTTHAYIAEIDGVPIGTIRLEEKEVSYTVAPEHRGKGYATEMLRWAVERFGPIRAEIKTVNVASRKAAERVEGVELHLLP